jgi:hypothetical protein
LRYACRITLPGFALGALTVGGFFWLPQYFLLRVAGYLEMEQDFVVKRPGTRLRFTKTGRRAFEDCVAFPCDIVSKDE